MSGKTLLPAGIVDLLPPLAEFEASTVERLMAAFSLYGYERVKPPLIEFEESLLGGNGAALTAQTFRLMDPVSQRMLALRPDFTMQVARIATERLNGRPRPLRLGYAGQVIHVTGSGLNQARQIGQVGAETIGAPTPGADAEIIAMAAETLIGLGARGLTVDLGIPTLVPALLAGVRLEPRTWRRLRTALDRKDVAAVKACAQPLGSERAAALAALVTLAGPAEPALAALMRLDLPPEAAAERAALAAVLDALQALAPDLTVSIDPVENRGFEYHTGVTFALFAAGVRSELGRGGRYLAHCPSANDADAGASDEPATGVTLFMDVVLEALPPPARPSRRVFVPPGSSPPADVRRLREYGWVAVSGFDTGGTPEAEARRLACAYVLTDGRPRPLDDDANQQEQG